MYKVLNKTGNFFDVSAEEGKTLCLGDSYFEGGSFPIDTNFDEIEEITLEEAEERQKKALELFDDTQSEKTIIAEI